MPGADPASGKAKEQPNGGARTLRDEPVGCNGGAPVSREHGQPGGAGEPCLEHGFSAEADAEPSRPEVSIVIPVFNEEEVLPELFAALDAVAPSLPQPVEYVFVDDGSSDQSLNLLRAYRSTAATVKVVELATNFGQHAAVRAGLEQAEGEVVVTMDADLQNHPADIPCLVEKARQGYDVVAGWRRHRRDRFSRRLASWIMNRVVGLATGHYLHDYGCMLRAYSRQVVDAINKCPERHTFVPVLANSFARRVTEVEVRHAERTRGTSKYPWAKLWRLNLDLLTGLTTLPLHWVSLGGLLIALIGLAFALYLMIRRLIVGPEVEGVFTLFAILFFFVGVQVFAIGMIGEYLTRIYDEVRARPAFLVRCVTVTTPSAGPAARNNSGGTGAGTHLAANEGVPAAAEDAPAQGG
ncbi:MAG: glycosyltransferase [Armatimonadetes bacterium]|nr:glycosyltransferase [Armatimonadota bacterium]